MTRRRILLPIVAALPGGILAVIGLTHPKYLTADTFGYWTAMHVVLTPLFPLLGIGVWFLLRGIRGIPAWTARVAAFVYIPFYTSTDAIDGVAAGTIRGLPSHEHSEITALYQIGDALGRVGTVALLVAMILTCFVLGQAARPRWALFGPGTVLVVLAGVGFLTSHIFFPTGTIVLLAFAVGMALLEASADSWRTRGADPTGTIAPPNPL